MPVSRPLKIPSLRPPILGSISRRTASRPFFLQIIEPSESTRLDSKSFFSVIQEPFIAFPMQTPKTGGIYSLLSASLAKEETKPLQHMITHGPATRNVFFLLLNLHYPPPARTGPKHEERLLQHRLRLPKVATQAETWHVSHFLR